MSESKLIRLGTFDAERSWRPSGLATLPAVRSPGGDRVAAAMDELLAVLCGPDDLLITGSALPDSFIGVLAGAADRPAVPASATRRYRRRRTPDSRAAAAARGARRPGRLRPGALRRSAGDRIPDPRLRPPHGTARCRRGVPGLLEDVVQRARTDDGTPRQPAPWPGRYRNS